MRSSLCETMRLGVTVVEPGLKISTR